MKKYLAYLVVPLLALGIFGGAMYAVAASDTAKPNRLSGLVSAIAQRFNLNVQDVQKVFDDHRAQGRATMEQKFIDRINALVAAGTLTQGQANNIFSKKTELETFKASLQGNTKAEIKVAIKAQLESLEQWAKDNNIPLKELGFAKWFLHRQHGLFWK